MILYVFLLANVFKVGEMICIFKHDFQVVGREFYVKSIFIFIVQCVQKPNMVNVAMNVYWWRFDIARFCVCGFVGRYLFCC